MSHIAQDIIYETRAEKLSLTSVSPADYSKKQTEARELAETNEFLVRDLGGHPSEWLIIGPNKLANSVKRKILSSFGVNVTSRRFLQHSVKDGSTSSSGHLSLPSFSDTTPPSPTGDVLPKAYKQSVGNLTVYAWMADITKMKVDIIVNAANEFLTNGAGTQTVFNLCLHNNNTVVFVTVQVHEMSLANGLLKQQSFTRKRGVAPQPTPLSTCPFLHSTCTRFLHLLLCRGGLCNPVRWWTVVG